MKIMVLNCGSSSLKFQVIETSHELIKNENEVVHAKGLVERIGFDDAIINYTPRGKDKIKKVEPVKDHRDAIQHVLSMLVDENIGILKSMTEIEAVGHRMVHGGEEFASSMLINEQVLEKMRECCDLAPLHNPPNLKGYEAADAVIPGVKHVAVFDTAFHQTMPASSYLYAIPIEYYKKFKVRRFGFHGTSHRYVFDRYCELTGKDKSKTSAITCHLGNGASVAAIKNGKSIDTSMGFTPLEGLVMGTRCGDLDPAIHQFLMNKEGLDIDAFNNILNKKSGVLGITGKSNDMREIEDAAVAKDPDCDLALEIYCYRLKKYIGSYLAAMNGADVIIFTGGVGENSDIVRERVCGELNGLGVDFDSGKNVEFNRKEGKITKDGSKIDVYIVPTNEELVIARDTYSCIEG